MKQINRKKIIVFKKFFYDEINNFRLFYQRKKISKVKDGGVIMNFSEKYYKQNNYLIV